MTLSSPSVETVQFIVKILSARQTEIADVPAAITEISRAVLQLKHGDSVAAALAPTARAAARAIARPELSAPKSAPRAKAAALPVPGLKPSSLPASGPLTPPVVAEAPRRGRPRRVVDLSPWVPVAEEPSAPEMPAQPRLLRRAAVATTEESAAIPSVIRAPDEPLRGVVKWFDGRTGKGALRLVGISGDIVLDAAVLARSGIKRLYKDQEIEATVQDQGGRARLMSLALPGRSGEAAGFQGGNEPGSAVRRQPRTVMVEIKRDGHRQSAARAEAEQVFGNVGSVKITRRGRP